MSLLRPDILVIGLDPSGVECALGAALARVPVVLVTQGPRGQRPAGGLDPLNRFAALGGTIIDGEARFLDRSLLRCGEHTLAPRRVVLALPARTGAPPVPGLEVAPRWQPGSPATAVLVLGGDKDAPALAQAARAEGHRAILVSEGAPLPGFDPEGSGALMTHLRRGGIDLHPDIALAQARVEFCPEGFLLHPAEGAPIGFSHWCGGMGAAPDLTSLALGEAGVSVEDGRIRCGDGLTSTNASVLALGATRSAQADAATARAEAAIALARILFRVDETGALSRLPRLVPGPMTLLEAGASASELNRRPRNALRHYRQPLSGGGLISVVTDSRARPLRVVVLSRHAALLVAPLLRALEERTPLDRLANLPLPGLDDADALSALGRQVLAERLATPSARLLMRVLRVFG